MSSSLSPVPIYTTRGDVGAYLVYPHFYNPVGEWIGWLTPDRRVYTVFGDYVGWLTQDKRIFRKRGYEFDQPRLKSPPPPPRFVPPARSPLPPLMAELKFDTLDVLDEQPELMPTLDAFAFSGDDAE